MNRVESTSCKTVLVVEDDAAILECLRDALEFEGYKVHTATDGEQGLTLLSKIERPCLILLDLMMPVMDGWGFLQAKKQSDVLATIPVVVVSAAGERARQVEADGYVKKPIDLDYLIGVIQRHCGKPATP